MGVGIYFKLFKRTDKFLEIENKVLLEGIEAAEIDIQDGKNYIKAVNKKIAANQEHKYNSVEEMVKDEEMPDWMRVK